MTSRVLFVLLGYLCGAIPFGYVYSVYIKGENIREHGSGNIGATNILRTFGWLPGVTTLLLDGLKGAVPAGVCYYVLFPGELALAVGVGAAAIIGHIYPVYLGFSGGKGVATSAGVFLTLAPLETAVALGIFVMGVGLSRYMSVGSLLGAATLPLVSGYLNGPSNPVTLAALALALMITWRHHENIKRLIEGTENEFF
jgi:glycerol-3-phosphate acyltransferase PlsY